MTIPSAEHPIPLFEQSTQFRHWRFSPTGLARVRAELNSGAVKRVKDNLEEERKTTDAPPAPEGGSTSNGAASTSTPASTAVSSETTPKATPPPPSDVQYLTVADELSLVTYYLRSVEQVCKAFKFPESVQATAITYLKRFYLCNTCMDYHPKNVMLTCLFLATKTENFSIAIDDFASRIPKTDRKDVLDLEFLVSQSLKFQFKVHHAHLAAHGMFIDVQQATSIPSSELEALFNSVRAFISSSRLTDAEFLFTPSQIALAAFSSTSPTITREWVEAKFGRKPSHLGGGRPPGSGPLAIGEDDGVKEEDRAKALEVEEVMQLAERIVKFVESAEKVVDKKMVTEVDRRLRFCRNPEKDPNSALFRKRKEEEEAEKQSKRLSKIAAQAKDDSNPFL